VVRGTVGNGSTGERAHESLAGRGHVQLAQRSTDFPAAGVRMSESRGGRRRLRPNADRWGPRGRAGGNTRSARLRENERLTYGPDAAVTPVSARVGDARSIRGRTQFLATGTHTPASQSERCGRNGGGPVWARSNSMAPEFFLFFLFFVHSFLCYFKFQLHFKFMFELLKFPSIQFDTHM
jgi:hypothetical protein